MPGPLIAYAALAGLQLLSGVQQANAIQKQAELQKQLDRFNIEQAELDAFNAEADGYTQSARYANVVEQINSTQRNTYYAADVDPNFGTAKDIQTDSSVTGKLNLIDIQNQAHQQALGYKKQANNMRGQSELNQIGAEFKAKGVRNAAILGAANTALTGYERSRAIQVEKAPIESTSQPLGTSAGDNDTALYGWAPRTYKSKYYGVIGRK